MSSSYWCFPAHNFFSTGLWMPMMVGYMDILHLVVVVISFPTEYKQWGQNTWVTLKQLINHKHWWFCWWSPEKPEAHQAGNHLEPQTSHMVLRKLPMNIPLIARFMGPTWDPFGADRPHVSAMSFAIWDNICPTHRPVAIMIQDWHFKDNCVCQRYKWRPLTLNLMGIMPNSYSGLNIDKMFHSWQDQIIVQSCFCRILIKSE